MRKRIGNVLLWLHDRVCPCEKEWTEFEATVYEGEDHDWIRKQQLLKIIYDPHNKS